MFTCTPPTVPVTGFAQTFLDDKPITAATITWLENGEQTSTQQTGTSKQSAFQFCALPNQQMTLVFSDADYPSVQTATVIVPKTGLNSIYNQPTFQVPRNITYSMLKELLTNERDFKVDNNDCQVVTTVTKYHKTLADDPQGIPGAVITLTHDNQPVQFTVKPFYFGMFKDGKTNPFSSNLTATSDDGGVALFNIQPSTTPYILSAVKAGTSFTNVSFICKAGQLINISPPLGPSASH